ncbi:MAG TPA: hypothetical protein VGW12_10795 [Pyrinomonadaceae bacterium]|nr:hypothetical protein [Pyrinomonadaceae bacterium]
MKDKQVNKTLDTFDEESFKLELEKVLPQMIAEISDMLEQRPPRITKKDKKEMAEMMSWGVGVSFSHLKPLEGIEGDLSQVDTFYRTWEELFHVLLRRSGTKIRLKPGEDIFGYYLRKYLAAIKPPYQVKRLKQYKAVREGIESLVVATMNYPGGKDAAKQLIEEFQEKHTKEYMRYANALNARVNSYQNINLERMTQQNITRLTDLYRDSAAAFENRLRLIVGLNHIVRGKAKTYDDLRKLGYNELLQAVHSSDNPLLHFLHGSVERHVRNAMMHSGVSCSLSKGLIKFADRKNVIEWTMKEFIRQTKKLIITIQTVEYLEALFNYACAYQSLAVMKFLRANPPSN